MLQNEVNTFSSKVCAALEYPMSHSLYINTNGHVENAVKKPQIGALYRLREG
jgi:hypothetical protein